MVLIVIAIVAHFVLTRLRIGWRIMAVGGSRRAAYNAGIPVRATVCLTYVVSGMLAALAGILYAARLSGAGPDTGIGLELTVVTAALLGGNSVGGGRGSVGKALMGAIIVSLLTNGLVRLGSPERRVLDGGRRSSCCIAIAIDVRWTQVATQPPRQSLCFAGLSRACRAAPLFDSGSSSPYAMNDRLRDVEVIGLGEVDGPEDVILDEDDNLYCSVRQGEIVRFLAPDYIKREVYAHVGGRPLGMAFDQDGGLVVCIGGMGLYRVDRLRKVKKLTAETNRSRLSIIDDSRMRLADDLDIAPGRQDLFQRGDDPLRVRGMGGRRAGGPRQRPDHPLRSRDRSHPDDPAQSSFRQRRLHRARQQVVAVRGNLGLPDQPLLARRPKGGNDRGRHRRPSRLSRQHQSRIARNLLARRSRARGRPTYDLAMTMPAFRRRMARRVAGDEWLFPNVNVGCVVHFDESGRVLETLWDLERREPSGDHLDARASRLSLSRRRHQQPHRADQACRTPIRTGPARRPIGERDR